MKDQIIMPERTQKAINFHKFDNIQIEEIVKNSSIKKELDKTKICKQINSGWIPFGWNQYEIKLIKQFTTKCKCLLPLVEWPV